MDAIQAALAAFPQTHKVGRLQPPTTRQKRRREKRASADTATLAMDALRLDPRPDPA